MATSLFPRLEFDPPAASLPTGWLGTWHATSTLTTGTSQCLLHTAAGAAQTSLAASASISSSTTSTLASIGIATAQFVSPPLAGQAAVSAGSWTVQMATSDAGGSTKTRQIAGAAAFLVNSSGALKTTIFNTTAVGTTATTAGTNTELGHSGTAISGATFTPASGDYLVLELGFSASQSTGSNVAVTGSIWTSGSTVIADNTATSNAETLITCPTTLTFQAAPNEPLQSPGITQGEATASGVAITANAAIIQTTVYQYATTLYMHLTAGSHPTAGITMPSGLVGSYIGPSTTNFGANAGDLSFVPFAAQISQAITVTSGDVNCVAQYASDALIAQTISAGNWTIGFATSQTFSQNYTPGVAIFLMTAAGTLRSTIIAAGTQWGATLNGAELGHVASIAGSSVTCQDGDYLILELSIQPATATSTTITTYDSGTTTPANNTSIASCRSFVTAPAAIWFKGQFQFYLRQELSGSVQSLGSIAPSNFIGSWTTTAGTVKGTAAGSTSLYQSGSITEATTTVSSVLVATSAALGQFCSNILIAQSIPAMSGPNAVGNFAFAVQASSASASYTGLLGVYLINGGTGALRTLVLTNGQMSGLRSSSSELTAYNSSNAAGSFAAFSPLQGDYIIIEVGVNNVSGATSDFTLHTDGTTPITADNTATSSALAVVTLQYALLLVRDPFPLVYPILESQLTNAVYRM